jgi:biopolymer transport protein ExbB
MSSTFQLLLSHLRQDPLMILMVLTSVFVVAVALERTLMMIRGYLSLRAVESRVLAPLRQGKLAEARQGCRAVGSPIGQVFVVGLDRATGKVQGDAGMAMSREQRRAVAAFKAWLWILGTTGALMPFVGLLGTVVGVMGSFRAIGESGQGGFAVVSSGISQALIATAVGLFVALEAVVLFNFLQNLAGGVARRLAYATDECLELIRLSAVAAVSPAGSARAGSTAE